MLSVDEDASDDEFSWTGNGNGNDENTINSNSCNSKLSSEVSNSKSFPVKRLSHLGGKKKPGMAGLARKQANLQQQKGPAEERRSEDQQSRAAGQRQELELGGRRAHEGS